MTCKLMGGDKAIYELEYYSPGGGFYEWKGYTPPKKGQPKYPYATMKELRQHAEKNNLTIAQVVMANEVAVSGKTEAQINAFLDKISRRDARDRQGGLAVKEGVLPGPIKLHSKAASRLSTGSGRRSRSDRAIGQVSAFALAASEENAARTPGHHGTDGRLGRRDARRRLRAREQPAEDAQWTRPARVSSPGPPSVPVQAQRHALGSRRAAASPRSASPPPCPRRFSRRSPGARRWSSRTPPNRPSSTTSG
jgi:hypothetical protein